MQSSEAFKAYINKVCQQVRWKRMHPSIAEELETHLYDQRDAFQAEGDDAQAAADKALREMGDAIIVGQRFDAAHRPKPQWAMLGAVAALLLIGLGLRLFLFPEIGLFDSLPIKLFAYGIGIAVLLAAYFADFSLLGKHPYAFANIVVFTTLCAYILFPGLMNGRRVWLTPTGGSINVLYILLPLYPLVVAVLIYANRGKNKAAILMVCTALAVFAGLVIMQAADFNMLRWQAAFRPELDPTGYGFFPLLTRELLSGAKWLGRGEIPAVYSDYIRNSAVFYNDVLLTSIAIRMGWAAVAAVLAVFAALFAMGFRLCYKQKSVLGKLVSFTILFTLAAQLLSYVVYNMGFQLFPPQSLPLVSHGNAALVVNMGLVGLMLSVFRTGSAVKDVQPVKKKKRIAA